MRSKTGDGCPLVAFTRLSRRLLDRAFTPRGPRSYQNPRARFSGLISKALAMLKLSMEARWKRANFQLTRCTQR